MVEPKIYKETVERLEALGFPFRLPLEVTHYIGGEFVRGENFFPVVYPATGEVIGTAPEGREKEVEQAVAAAKEAFKKWSKMPPSQRRPYLRRFAEKIREYKPVFEVLETLDVGRPIHENRLGYVDRMANNIEFFADFAVTHGSEAYPMENGYINYVLRFPVGVAALITPWNMPSMLATWKIGPALAAGDTVVLKPAQDTPLTALAIADVLQRAGVPAGVVNVVVTNPSGPAVAAMMDSGKVRKLSFTGSTKVGSILLAQAAPRVINCSMELGGNAPFLVFGDADIDAAVDGAMLAKMRNGGAACTAANRFYVHDSVLAEFTDKLTARMSALVLGNGLDATTTLGPLVSRAEQESVTKMVDGAVSRGAKVLCGGKSVTTPAFGFQATVLANVSPDDEILKDEIFGPVAPIVSCSNDAEMIRLANDVEYGLVSYVFTRDAAKGMRVAESLEAGMIGFNRGIVSDPAAPFGGVKASGIGREGGHDGLLAFLETKYVAGNW